jgi:hypothetical protein
MTGMCSWETERHLSFCGAEGRQLGQDASQMAKRVCNALCAVQAHPGPPRQVPHLPGTRPLNALRYSHQADSAASEAQVYAHVQGQPLDAW